MVPPYDHRTLQEIQDELRLRIEQATAEFNRTKAERDRLTDISIDVAGTSDGALAVPNSKRQHQEAMRRLRKALRAFNDFNTAGLH